MNEAAAINAIRDSHPPNLTAFPASAFEESVMIAGIKRTLPSEAEA